METDKANDILRRYNALTIGQKLLFIQLMDQSFPADLPGGDDAAADN